MTGPFTEDALLAYWDGRGAETGARTVARGRDEIAASSAFGEDVEILVSVDDGASRVAEGRNADGSFAASLQLDRAGAITRALVYRTLPIDPSPTWATGESA